MRPLRPWLTFHWLSSVLVSSNAVMSTDCVGGSTMSCGRIGAGTPMIRFNESGSASEIRPS